MVDDEDRTLSLNRKVLGSQRHENEETSLTSNGTIWKKQHHLGHTRKSPIAIPYLGSNSQSSAKCEVHLWNSKQKEESVEG